MGLLDGKVGIITGAASGIGAATARLLAREGARLVLTDIDDAAGSALAEDIGGPYLHHAVSDEDGWPDVIAVAERLGRLDIMVANAGIGIMGALVDMSLKDWRRQMAINVDGVFLSAKYCIPAMRRAGNGGSIVMLSSVAGLRGSAGVRDTAQPRGRCGGSPSRWRWNASRQATASGSIRCIRGSSRRRYGASCRAKATSQ